MSIPHWQSREALLLAPYAMHGRDSLGRQYAEEPHPYRSPYQRDRDRVLHSAAFRRLSGKMQVFTGDMGDYHRTRLTHTHEVASIARTIGRVLRLNEDLIEALALLHDIGHPPFGHCGEDALDACMRAEGGFSHNRFALELAQRLEQRHTPFPGLNLTAEVLGGQEHRTKKESPRTPLLEVQVVDAADSIAYDAHDLDDALKLGLLQWNQLRGLALVERALGGQPAVPCDDPRRQILVHSLIDLQIEDFLQSSRHILSEVHDLDASAARDLGIRLGLSVSLESEKRELEDFLFQQVYRHPRLIEIRSRAATRLTQLFHSLVAYPQRLPERFQQMVLKRSPTIATGYFLAGMTDRFCDDQYTRVVELGREQADDWS
jgi:dGTPase